MNEKGICDFGGEKWALWSGHTVGTIIIIALYTTILNRLRKFSL